MPLPLRDEKGCDPHRDEDESPNRYGRREAALSLLAGRLGRSVLGIACVIPIRSWLNRSTHLFVSRVGGAMQVSAAVKIGSAWSNIVRAKLSPTGLLRLAKEKPRQPRVGRLLAVAVSQPLALRNLVPQDLLPPQGPSMARRTIDVRRGDQWGIGLDKSEVHRITNDRTGHAVAAATPSAELGADDRDHFDPGLAEQGVRVSIAVVSEDHARRSANEIGAAIPLGALAHVVGAAGLDNAHRLEPQCFTGRFDETAFVLVQV